MELQAQVDKLLNSGIYFSIFWLAGIGSFISVRRALRARRMIIKSNRQLTGTGKIWWCFIVGGFGLLLWGGGLIAIIASYLIQTASGPPR